jgi:hypothetical protein
LQGEYERLPGRHIQVQAAAFQIVDVAIVDGLSQQVGQRPLVLPKVRKRQPDVTLALVARLIHRHLQPLAVGALPGKRQNAL